MTIQFNPNQNKYDYDGLVLVKEVKVAPQHTVVFTITPQKLVQANVLHDKKVYPLTLPNELSAKTNAETLQTKLQHFYCRLKYTKDKQYVLSLSSKVTHTVTQSSIYKSISLINHAKKSKQGKWKWALGGAITTLGAISLYHYFKPTKSDDEKKQLMCILESSASSSFSSSYSLYATTIGPLASLWHLMNQKDNLINFIHSFDRYYHCSFVDDKNTEQLILKCHDWMLIKKEDHVYDWSIGLIPDGKELVKLFKFLFIILLSREANCSEVKISASILDDIQLLFPEFEEGKKDQPFKLGILNATELLKKLGSFIENEIVEFETIEV